MRIITSNNLCMYRPTLNAPYKLRIIRKVLFSSIRWWPYCILNGATIVHFPSTCMPQKMVKSRYYLPLVQERKHLMWDSLLTSPARYGIQEKTTADTWQTPWSHRTRLRPPWARIAGIVDHRPAARRRGSGCRPRRCRGSRVGGRGWLPFAYHEMLPSMSWPWVLRRHWHRQTMSARPLCIVR